MSQGPCDLGRATSRPALACAAIINVATGNVSASASIISRTIFDFLFFASTDRLVLEQKRSELAQASAPGQEFVSRFRLHIRGVTSQECKTENCSFHKCIVETSHHEFGAAI
jgi:hypothetical protein